MVYSQVSPTPSELVNLSLCILKDFGCTRGETVHKVTIIFLNVLPNYKTVVLFKLMVWTS